MRKITGIIKINYRYVIFSEFEILLTNMSFKQDHFLLTVLGILF